MARRTRARSAPSAVTPWARPRPGRGEHDRGARRERGRRRSRGARTRRRRHCPRLPRPVHRTPVHEGDALLRALLPTGAPHSARRPHRHARACILTPRWTRLAHPAPPLTSGPSMRRVRTVVARSEGKVQFIPLRELWAVSGVLADTFPLDRTLARAAPVVPPARPTGPGWCSSTGPSPTATGPRSSPSATRPWVPAVVVAVARGGGRAPSPAVAPRSRCSAAPRCGCVRGRSGVAVRRDAARARSRVAPGGLLVADFVALRPGAGMAWVADALDSVGERHPVRRAPAGLGRRAPRRGARAPLHPSTRAPSSRPDHGRRPGGHDPGARLSSAPSIRRPGGDEPSGR